MTNEEYTAVQEQLKLISTIMLDMDLQGCLDRQSESEAIGPLLNPTLFIAAQDRFSIVQRLTRAAFKFQQELIECKSQLDKL